MAAVSSTKEAPVTEDGPDEKGQVSRAAHLLAAMTMLSRVAGLLRDVSVGAVFGTSAAADAFFVAFRIPNLMRRMVAEGATSAAFVPVFTESLANEGLEGCMTASAAVGGTAIVVLAVLTVVGMALAGPLTALFAPGFQADPSKQALTVSLTRWTFPYLFLVGTAAWEMGVHHTLRRFALPAAGPVLMNLAIIAAALGVAPHLSSPAWALVGGVLAGGVLQACVQMPSLRRLGLRPRMLLAVRHPAVARCARLMVAAVAGGSIYQVSVVVATVFASLLPARTVSYLWYADRVFEFPLGIVAVAVGTAALPSLAAQASSRRLEAMGQTLVHSMSLTIAFCLPAAIGLLLLARDITTLLFERGSFTASDSAMTAWALEAGVPGLLGVAMVRVLSAAFFALEKPRIPVLAGLGSLVLSCILSVALMGPVQDVTSWAGAPVQWLQQHIGIVDMRHAGLSLATGLSASVDAAVLLVVVRRVLPSLDLAPLARSTLVHAAAGVAMAIAVEGWMSVSSQWSFGGVLALKVGVAVTLGCASYLAVASRLGSAEIDELLARFRTSATATGGIDGRAPS
ncbi:MAG TPA: murein biosynthesis integral membrane protein MurJ [Candidatus Binatia bacterium]